MPSLPTHKDPCIQDQKVRANRYLIVTILSILVLILSFTVAAYGRAAEIAERAEDIDSNAKAIAVQQESLRNLKDTLDKLDQNISSGFDRMDDKLDRRSPTP